jgi:hypothetical protein
MVWCIKLCNQQIFHNYRTHIVYSKKLRWTESNCSWLSRNIFDVVQQAKRQPTEVGKKSDCGQKSVGNGNHLTQGKTHNREVFCLFLRELKVKPFVWSEPVVSVCSDRSAITHSALIKVWNSIAITNNTQRTQTMGHERFLRGYWICQRNAGHWYS